MKIGIMGGTFDPIHNGHLMLGKTAYRMFELNEVWFLPNGNPPHKDNAFIDTGVSERVEMVRLAIRDFDYFRLEEYEALRSQVSYSYETMEYFSEKYKDTEFYFIIGADSLFAIDTWAKPERLFKTCTILAACRDDIDTRDKMEEKMSELRQEYNARIELLPAPLMPISSSELRDRLQKGEDTHDMIPGEVAKYISKHHLYEENHL